MFTVTGNHKHIVILDDPERGLCARAERPDYDISNRDAIIEALVDQLTEVTIEKIIGRMWPAGSTLSIITPPIYGWLRHRLILDVNARFEISTEFGILFPVLSIEFVPVTRREMAIIVVGDMTRLSEMERLEFKRG